MKDLLTLGQMLAVHARLSPDRIGARDLDRAMTFGQWNERSCRLANALLGLGLQGKRMKPIYSYDRSAFCHETPPVAGFYRVSAPVTSPKGPSDRIADLHAFALGTAPAWPGSILCILATTSMPASRCARRCSRRAGTSCSPASLPRIRPSRSI